MFQDKVMLKGPSKSNALEILISINEIVKGIEKEFNEGEENIWIILPRVGHVYLIMSKTFKDISEMTQFLDKKKHLSEYFSLNHARLAEKIEKIGPKVWFEGFKEIISLFKEYTFFSNVYYKTYDEFSEKSRDNPKKTRAIMKLSSKNFDIFEIGPGTAPIMRRLLEKGYSVHGIEIDPLMIEQAGKISGECQRRILNGDFFEHELKDESYDLFYMESGFFLFTKTKSNEIIFETSSSLQIDDVALTLGKVYKALKKGGLFMIGIQGLMEKILIDENISFEMKRVQNQDSASRVLNFYLKRGLLKKDLLHQIFQQRSTFSLEKFKDWARSSGFSEIISYDGEWIVLKK